MDSWKIEFTRSSEKDFSKLPPIAQKEIRNYLRNRVLGTDNPRQFGKALRGEKSDLWRYRVGKYRVICRLEDNRLVVYVVHLGKRDKVYKNL